MPSLLMRKFAVGLTLTAFTSGCAAVYTTQIESYPDDARIYVNGEELGKGTARVPGAKYAGPRELKVLIKRRGYKNAETTLKNEFDWGYFGTQMGWNTLLTGAVLAPYIFYPRLETEPFVIAAAGVFLGTSMYTALNSHKFRQVFEFNLVKDPAFGGAFAADDDLPGHADNEASEPRIVTDIDVARLSPVRNEKAFALVIGVERYSSGVPRAHYARRDAVAAKQHLVRTLGVPDDNVLTLIDEKATNASIRTAVEGQLKSWVTPGKSDVYVYFSGHGVPDMNSKAPYLVPYDGNTFYPATSCYSLAKLYKALQDLDARSVTVVLDACFSGGAGRDVAPASLIANARPLSIEAKPSDVPPGVVVFAGATGEQVSSGYQKMQHGLFTYYFLKGLQGEADLNGDKRVTTSEMQTYLAGTISIEARRINRVQNPVMLGGDPDRVLVSY